MSKRKKRDKNKKTEPRAPGNGPRPEPVSAIQALNEMARPRAQTDDSSVEGLCLDVIEVIDRVTAVIESEKQAAEGEALDEVWLGRMDAILRLLIRALERQEVRPLDLTTAPPGTATVLQVVEDPTLQRDTVIEVIHRGWMWRGEILRKAVVVLGTPAKSTPLAGEDEESSEAGGGTPAGTSQDAADGEEN